MDINNIVKKRDVLLPKIVKIAQSIEDIATSFLEEIELSKQEKEDAESNEKGLDIIKENTANEKMMDYDEIDRVKFENYNIRKIYKDIISFAMKKLNRRISEVKVMPDLCKCQFEPQGK